MKFFGSRSSRDKDSPDSRLGPVSRAGNDSKLGSLFPLGADTDADEAEREAEARRREDLLAVRKQLLQVVLAKTIQKTTVPPAWIGGELNPMVLESGEEWIEVRLSVQVDEPRFLTYLTSFQAELERRLIAAAPDAKEWLSGITWKLTPDAIYEMPLPHADYWEHVQADRLLTARQKGSTDWDRESLARHFSDTNPSEFMVEFDDTNPPDLGPEDIAPPRG